MLDEENDVWYGYVPRDYQDVELPERFQCRLNESGMEEYYDWLARHLLTTEFELSEAQRKYLGDFTDSCLGSMLCSIETDLCHCNLWVYEAVRAGYAGIPYIVFKAEQYEGWKQLCELVDDDIKFEDFCVPEHLYNQAVAECVYEGGPPKFETVDMGIRPMMACCVRRCKDFAEAKQEIKGFFEMYSSDCTK
jgi:hypothetical protein